MKPSTSVRSPFSSGPVSLRTLPLPVHVPPARLLPLRPPRRRRHSMRWILVLVLLVLPASWLARTGRLRIGSESVRMLTLGSGGRVSAEGRVVAFPGAEVRLAAERTGRLVRVLVREGQRVRAGQLLAEIEAADLRAALARAQARVAESAAERHLAELSLGRLQQLVRSDVSAPDALDEAQRNLDIARARSDLARAESSFQEAQVRASTVVAPFSGTVTERHADPGETVVLGQPVVTLADLSRLRIEAEADEADAAALEVGAAVRIRADGHPGRTWRGRVEELGQAVTTRRLKSQDPRRPSDTRIVPVKVAVQGRLPLKLGTTVQIEIDASRRQTPSDRSAAP